MLGQQRLHTFKELSRLPHDECVAEIVLGAELGVQALSTDADRRRDGAHPHRRPASCEHHVAGGIERQLTQSRPAEGPGFGPKVHDSHGEKPNPTDINSLSVETS